MSLKPCNICQSNPPQANLDYFSLAAVESQPGFTICEGCIRLLYQALGSIPSENQKNASKPKESIHNFDPQDVSKHLDQFIIGQAEAKRLVAVAVFQHYQRINNPDLKRKSNIMIIGPTGSGKTEIARSIAALLNVPFAQVDVTTMTPRGYIGESPEVCVEKLLAAAGGNVQEAEKGIIFLDEFDKIPSGADYGSFKAKAVQQEILTIVEGSKVDIKVGGDQGGQKVSVDTSKILFIAAGSFAGIEKHMQSDSHRVMGIGTNLAPPEDLSNSRPTIKDFISFGFIPELLGRFPVECYTEQLSTADLCRVLTEPKDSILNYYQTLFLGAGSKLIVTEACLLSLAEKAVLEKLGARGLSKQLELRLQPLMYDIHLYRGQCVTVGVTDLTTAALEVAASQVEG
jgi:ATP-dependent Clp protease ATP-binding subunit ClpX